MTDEPYFILDDADDLIHDPIRITKSCAIQHLEGLQSEEGVRQLQRVDARTATEMIARGSATLCRHCRYQKEEVHL